MRTTSFAALPCLTPRLATLVQTVCYALFLGMIVMSWPQPALAQESCTLSQITNVTNTLPAGVLAVTMNAAGTRIAFVLQADLTGGNPDLSFELFLYDTPTGAFTQITDGGGRGPLDECRRHPHRLHIEQRNQAV